MSIGIRGKNCKCESCHTTVSSNPAPLPPIKNNQSNQEAKTNYAAAGDFFPNLKSPNGLWGLSSNIFFHPQKFYSAVFSVAEKLDPTPAEIPPDPALEKEWNQAVTKFKKSINEENPEKQQAAFRELREIAIKRLHIDAYQQKIDESERKAKELDDTYSKWEKDNQSSINIHSMCHGSDDKKDKSVEEFKKRELENRELFGLVARQHSVVAKWQLLRKHAIDKLENELLDVIDSIDGEPVANKADKGKNLSSLSASIIADTFRSIADIERAKKYYNIAAEAPMQTRANSVWNRLQALEMDILSGDEKRIKEATEKILEIRSGLTELLSRAYEDEIEAEITSPAEADERADEIIVEDRTSPVGSPDAIHEVDALSWGLLYDAYTYDFEKNRDKLHNLENERRQMVKGRIGKAQYVESLVNLRNMERVSVSQTMHWGEIESSLRSKGDVAAREKWELLVQDVGDIYKLISPHMKRERGDPLFEGFASVNWNTFVDGNMARDWPLVAIKNASDYLLKPIAAKSCNVGSDCFRNVAPWFYDGKGNTVGFAETEFVEHQLATIHERAPQLFTSDGRLNPHVDLSATKEGKKAAEDLISIYWKSDDTLREVGGPLAASAVCFAAGAAFSETLAAPILASLFCGSLATFGNREYNKSRAYDKYRQAAATGISRISGEEADVHRRTWYFTEGVNSLVNATAIGPMMAIWGRIGLTAAKTGGVAAGKTALGFGDWIVSEGGAKAMFSKLAAAPLNTAKSAVVKMASGLGSAGGWFWKLSPSAKVIWAATIPTAADYLFVDRKGHFKPGDFELNHWWGYAGAAVLTAEAGYRIFRTSWQPNFAAKMDAKAAHVLAMEKTGDSVLASRAAKIAFGRNFLMRAGAYLTSTDYYLVKKNKYGNWNLVDFNAPRTSQKEKHLYEKQFGLDAALGTVGTLLLAANWLPDEFMRMEKLNQIVLGGGLILFGADIIPDGKVNSPSLGGIGGSAVIAVLGNRILNVNTAGSLISVPFRLLYEYGIQTIQDASMADPDPIRMMSSTGESAVTMMVTKGSYMGNHFWNSFSAGKALASIASKVPYLKNLRSVQDLGRYSAYGNQDIVIEGFAKPISTGAPQIVSWEAEVKAPSYTRSIKSSSGTGQATELNFRLRGDKHWNGEITSGRELASNPRDKEIRIVRDSGETRFYYKQTVTGKYKQIPEKVLREQGYQWYEDEGKLAELRPVREGYFQTKTKVLTAKEIKKTTVPSEQADKLSRAEQAGWKYDAEREQFYKHWYLYPYHPEIIAEEEAAAISQGGITKKMPKYKEIESTEDHKIFMATVKVGGNEKMILAKVKKVRIYANEIRVGGNKHFLWSGPRDKAKYRYWGIAAQSTYIVPQLILAQEVIFVKTSAADRNYQQMQRGINILVSTLITYPFIQAPLGMDNLLARGVGYTVGFIPMFAGTYFFPTYRNTAPGQTTFYNHLDGNKKWYNFLNSSDAFQSYGRISTSWNPMPWGPAHGCFSKFEPKAIINMRDGMDCRLDLSNGMAACDSEPCLNLPDKTLDQIQRKEHNLNLKMEKRFNALAKLFDKKMETERTSDLSCRERRTLIIWGAWFKYLIRTHANEEKLAVLRDLEQKHKWFFDMIPYLTSEQQWEDFIEQVNNDDAKVSKFYFEPSIQQH